jgi:hypothetical protein
MRGLGAAIVLALVVTTAAWAGGDAMQDEEVKPPSSFEIPFDGSGQLATVWSWGRNRPDAPKALVLTAHGESRRLDVEAPRRVRWRSPTELLVEQYVWPVRDGSGSRIVRVSREGEVLEVLSDREGLGEVEPSPDGALVVLARDNQKGFQGLEVRGLEQGFRLLIDHPKPTSPDMGSMPTPPVWSPDGSKFAVALYAPNLPEEPGRLYPRLAIVSRDTPGYTRLPDSPPGQEAVRGGVIPLFWNEDGIYVRTTHVGSGLLRCDPKGSGCTPVYAPGEHRSLLSGVQAGGQIALLLVQDPSVDRFETRAKEIHEVNLTTGEGRMLLRLPDGVFISDLDWIGDTGAH